MTAPKASRHQAARDVHEQIVALAHGQGAGVFFQLGLGLVGDEAGDGEGQGLRVHALHAAVLTEVGQLDRRDLEAARLVGRDAEIELAAHLAVAEILLFQRARQFRELPQLEIGWQDHGHGAWPDGCDGECDGVTHVGLCLVGAHRHRRGVGWRTLHDRVSGIHGHGGEQGEKKGRAQWRILRARASKKLVRAGR